jgi:hypothetical protein
LPERRNQYLAKLQLQVQLRQALLLLVSHLLRPFHPGVVCSNRVNTFHVHRLMMELPSVHAAVLSLVAKLASQISTSIPRNPAAEPDLNGLMPLSLVTYEQVTPDPFNRPQFLPKPESKFNLSLSGWLDTTQNREITRFHSGSDGHV